MIKFLLISLIAVSSLIITPEGHAGNMIPAETPTTVELSNTDINRIICPGPMNDLIFSKEKGMTGHFSGNNAFVKFQIEDVGTKYIYADMPSELFVICNNAVYTLMATPADIPSVTLRLAPPRGDNFKKNIGHYKNLPLEKMALRIISEAYHENYPSSYKIAEQNSEVTLSADLETKLLQVVNVDGVGLRLKKYMVKSLAESRIDIAEATFLTPAISSSILAVAVEYHSLQPGDTTLVFVVDQKERQK